MTTPFARYLKRDAVNRAVRTFAHSIIAAALVAALDAIVQVVASALTAKAGGATVNWHEVYNAAKLAGATALFAPLVAYIHRLKIDPSPIPSLPPPTPVPAQPVRADKTGL
jgi:hypothetical protein